MLWLDSHVSSLGHDRHLWYIFFPHQPKSPPDGVAQRVRRCSILQIMPSFMFCRTFLGCCNNLVPWLTCDICFEMIAKMDRMSEQSRKDVNPNLWAPVCTARHSWSVGCCFDVNIADTSKAFFCALVGLCAWRAVPSADNSWLGIEVKAKPGWNYTTWFDFLSRSNPGHWWRSISMDRKSM